MTELTYAGIFVPSGSKDEPGSVGVLLLNCEAELRDENGKEVAPGERGEVYVRDPSVSLGYWKNEKATAETLLSGSWLQTGDVAINDAEG